jgi:hypothetical protein
MNRFFTVALVFVAATGCLSVEGARENAAQRHCKFEQRCGNIGSGQQYATVNECLVDKRGFWQGQWPTDRCDGRINGDNLNVCLTAIENTQCDNFVDYFATLTKCGTDDVCTAGAPPSGCNCANGQTCCNNQCVTLSNDRNNCGACGTTCGSSVSCQSGQCR